MKLPIFVMTCLSVCLPVSASPAEERSLIFEGIRHSSLRPLVEISSDKASYQLNETAILRASLSTKPHDPSYELDLVANLNGNNLFLERLTDFEFYASLPMVQANTYTFEVQVVFQEKEYARDLIMAIRNLGDEIVQIESELLSETDPERITQLQAQLARKQSLKSSTEAELAQHRSPVGNPTQVQFIAE